MGAASAAGKRGAGAGPVLRRGARTCGLVACVAAYALFLPAWRLLGSDALALLPAQARRRSISGQKIAHVFELESDKARSAQRRQTYHSTWCKLHNLGIFKKHVFYKWTSYKYISDMDFVLKCVTPDVLIKLRGIKASMLFPSPHNGSK
jgi:hypothetical protein